MSSYAVAPLFLIRAAGVSFDHLERLATSRTSNCARELLERRREFTTCKRAVEELLRYRGHGLNEETFRAWRKALRNDTAHELIGEADPRLAAYVRAANAVAECETRLNDVFGEELQAGREELFKTARSILPPYLVFAGPGAQELLATLTLAPSESVLARRNARAGDRERHIFLYLQRICAKNDTFSAFGPSAWGRIEQMEDKSRFVLQQTSRVSHVYFERWCAHAVAQALNRDPAVRPEIAPRRHPNGSLCGAHFVRSDLGEETLLEEDALALLLRCDGAAPAFAITDERHLLEQLAAKGIVHWEVEVPALIPDPLEVILEHVRKWRDNDVRVRWLSRLEPLAALLVAFGAGHDPTVRATIIAEAHDAIAKLGYERKDSQRFLYAATNPIGEECSRHDALAVGASLTNDLARDIEPWIDFWRDTYAFVASRVAAGLLRLFTSAPVKAGAVALPQFLQHCARHNMSLQHHGIVALGVIAFQEVKRAFLDQIADRLDCEELRLTAEDCRVLRRRFEFPQFDEYTYPSADLQISARSAEAIERGEHQWIVSELHPPVAMLHHCFYWNCPDPAALRQALASTTCGKPNFHYGFSAADFTSHTAVRIFDALPTQTFFVAPQRGDPRWQTVSPGDAEVYVEDSTGDVCLRKRGSHEFLGSFARSWLIPVGFHPFHFGSPPHMPRLRCGNAIVQRRSWTITLEEFRTPRETGVSSGLIIATEELRATRDLPRYVYIRPTEQALRRSGAEGRDKDTKPVFIDLESYLSIEILYRWLKKAGEVEVTEMLPDPDHLCWREEDGRHTFELRTLIVPRS